MFHIERLVEQGFAVVTIGATAESMFSIYPDGRFIRQADKLSTMESTETGIWDQLLQARVEDILYTAGHLQELESCFPSPWMDMERVGLVGHSLGGVAVSQVQGTISQYATSFLRGYVTDNHQAYQGLLQREVMNKDGVYEIDRKGIILVR